jgi:single-strand DNA-binding protein
MSVNKVILLGYVGKDPEMKEFESGKVAKMTIATTEKGYKLKSGIEIPDRTEWHNILLWGGLAEVAEKYINKGMQVYIEGKIQTRSWADKDGVTHYTTEVVASDLQMLGKREQGAKVVTTPTAINTKVIDNDLPF